MDFDLYAAGPAPKPPTIPNLIWDRLPAGTLVASFEFVYSRMWSEDHAALRSIGFGLHPSRYGSKVLFDPTAANPRTVTEVLAGLYAKHARFIADRARIDAKHADVHRRQRGAIERGTAVIAQHGETFSRCGRIKTLLAKQYHLDGDKLEIDRLCDIVEAKAAALVQP